MNKVVSVSINVSKTLYIAHSLEKLSCEVANYRFNKKIIQSKGELAESINRTIIGLEQIGYALSDLYLHTGELTRKMAIEFQETDDKLAKGFVVKEEKL